MRGVVFWMTVVAGMALATGVGASPGTAHAQEIDKIPTDQLKRAVLAEIDKIQRLGDLGLRTYPTDGAVPSTLTIDWGNGVVHNAGYWCDGDCASALPELAGYHGTAFQWPIADRRGELTETVHSAMLIDAVDQDGQFAFDGDGNLLSPSGQVTGAEGSLVPYWYFGIEGGGNVVNFAVLGLAEEPSGSDYFQWPWTFLGAGVAQANGSTHEVVVYDAEMSEYAVILGLIALVAWSGYLLLGTDLESRLDAVEAAISGLEAP